MKTLVSNHQTIPITAPVATTKMMIAAGIPTIQNGIALRTVFYSPWTSTSVFSLISRLHCGHFAKRFASLSGWIDPRVATEVVRVTRRSLNCFDVE